jgi:hypothetical protein
MTTAADIKAIATLEDAKIWNEQQDQFLWAEDKLAQHDIDPKWVGNLEYEYDVLLGHADHIQPLEA